MGTNEILMKDNKRFQYAVPVALNHEDTGGNSEKITRIKPFIRKNINGKE